MPATTTRTKVDVDALLLVGEELAIRIERVERAIGQFAYLTQGEKGYPTLVRHAPDVAELMREWFEATESVSDVYGAPRRPRETTVAVHIDQEERT